MNYRPVILIGNGIRNNPALVEHLCSLEIPVLTTWMAADLLSEDNPAFCGRPGRQGQRAANIIQQKATHLYCFGARLDGEQVAYNYDRFAPNAQKYIYDVDEAEFQKYPGRWVCKQIDLKFSATFVIEKNFKSIPWEICHPEPNWLSWCKALYTRFRPELDGENDSEKFVNPFYLMTLLHEHSQNNDVYAIGSSGDAPNAFYQSYKVKQGQRVSNVCTIGAMGADIPMAIGTAVATGKNVICVTGDGGFQMNAQELEVVHRLRLPITFFVFNNNGYNSIRNAQKARFGRVTGADASTGMTLPQLDLIADAYKILYMPLRGKDLPDFKRCFDIRPMIVEVFIDQDWVQCPRLMTRKVNNDYVVDDMENMCPYLPEDELKEIMEQ